MIFQAVSLRAKPFNKTEIKSKEDNPKITATLSCKAGKVPQGAHRPLKSLHFAI